MFPSQSEGMPITLSIEVATWLTSNWSGLAIIE